MAFDPVPLNTQELLEIHSSISVELDTRRNEPCDHDSDRVVTLTFCDQTIDVHQCDHCCRYNGAGHAWWVDTTELCELIKPNCEHSFRRDQLWEHDNGYGRQKWIVGERCLICNRQRSWKGSGSWFDPES